MCIKQHLSFNELEFISGVAMATPETAALNKQTSNSESVECTVESLRSQHH